MRFKQSIPDKMYNKIFTKILDSSIWLEPTPTRIVWLTFLAAMDEDGFAQFASVPNLAHRAVLTIEDTQKAVECLESPDVNSSDPEFEGRRVERVTGGWMILNSSKYRDLVTRAVIKEQTRKRVAAFRDKKAGNAPVTHDNAEVTDNNDPVTQSVSYSDTSTKASTEEAERSVVEAWNEMAQSCDLPTCRLTDGRKAQIKTRLKDKFWRENYRPAMDAIPDRPFLLGESERGWKADFEFFLKPDTVTKILEGKYAGGKPQELFKPPTGV